MVQNIRFASILGLFSLQMVFQVLEEYSQVYLLGSILFPNGFSLDHIRNVFKHPIYDKTSKLAHETWALLLHPYLLQKCTQGYLLDDMVHLYLYFLHNSKR
jgi:hypothetical protein